MPASLTKESMSYKEYKRQDELITKLRLIRRVLVDGSTQAQTATAFHCHRNTVGKFVKLFQTKINSRYQQRLLTDSFVHQELAVLLAPLTDASTRPHSHSLEATADQAQEVVAVFTELRVKVGPEKLLTMLRRKFMDSTDEVKASLTTIKLSKLKGIYKREKLQIEKARATSGSYRPIYDYTALSCFEAMHFDTKHIRDQKALPPKVYDYFLKNIGVIPSYEWNLIDAKSRTRFTAYSHEINSEFGLKFLLFCVQFIRTMFNNSETKITIGYDNGIEFCSGSPLKLANWNDLLKQLHATAYAYNPYWDVRKNLIERSHRSDDEEFLIPRGEFIATEADFMREATAYGFYWNCQRPHSGIGMKGRTPFEVLKDSGVIGCQHILAFPVLLLDREIEKLRKCTEPLLFAQEVRRAEQKNQHRVLDPKTLINISSKYDFFNSRAQNVLTYYPKACIITAQK
jgi:hypothetical protein